MNKIVRCAINPAVAARVGGGFVVGVALLCACSSAVAADDAQLSSQASTTAVSSNQTAAATAPIEALPLMIPDETWKRLTLTAEQQAQVQALQTALYADQLAAIRSMAAQAEPLRVALAAAKH